MNKTFEENINDVRTARRGVEVREAMAESLEYVEGFASASTQKAEEAAASAEIAAEAKEAAATSAQTAERQAGIATQQAEAAESSKTAAAESAKRAERFAVETEGRVTTDKTLTVSGAAADAAAVGDRINAIKIETDPTLTVSGAAADAAAVGGIVLPRVVVQTEAGSNVVLSDGEKSVSGVAAGGSFSAALPHDGEWTVTATLGTDAATETVQAEYCRTKTLTLTCVHIYGASWDGTSTTKWSRTDEAAEFTDPVPYVAGASSYGSPFDNLQPWAGMVKSERTGGTMVSIPKFWYKLEQNGAGMTIRIANKAVEGYSVSPAHIDRGDGHGERDVVYIGRYHCNSSYKSGTGIPETGIDRSSARSSIHKLGSTIWQSDFAMRFTIWLLYLVEFCDWNSQSAIGHGCGSGSSTQSMGYTDLMPYHTGTTQSSRTTYGCGTQYRNIEGLWDNVQDWCDGCYYNSNGLNVILNPANFSDGSGGTAVGTPSNGYPSAFTVKTTGGYPLFIPTAASGSESTYSCDNWGFYSSRPCLYVGGCWLQATSLGLFCVYYSPVSGTIEYVGCRLQELPNS